MSKHLLRSSAICFAIVILLGAFAGCSIQNESASSVRPDVIHQTYSVTYDGATKKTTVIARFRIAEVSGKSLRLDGLAKVAHSAYEMKEVNSSDLGIHYEGSGDGFLADHTIEYIDTHGKVLKNAARLVSIEFAADAPVKICRSTLDTFPFVGAPLDAAESFRLVVNPPHQSQDFINPYALPGSKEISVNQNNDLAKFADGDINLQLERSRIMQLQQATSRGGSMTATYRSSPRKVTVGP